MAVWLVISNLFYINRTDPEYIGLLDSWEYGDFWFIYFFYCVLAYFIFAIPLLAYSIILEFFCRKRISRYCVTGVFGIAIGGFLAWQTTGAFRLLTTWYLLEAWAQFIGCVAVMMFVVIAIDFRIEDKLLN